MVTVRNLTGEDVPALVRLYGEYEWWADRDAGAVRRALAETPVAVGVEVDDTLVAAARVLTDHVYYATVYDVIVADDRRGEGLGELLLAGVLEHPALADVDGLWLLCRAGLVPFYESVGFERFDEDVDVPEGGSERLVQMIYRQSD